MTVLPNLDYMDHLDKQIFSYRRFLRRIDVGGAEERRRELCL